MEAKSCKTTTYTDGKGVYVYNAQYVSTFNANVLDGYEYDVDGVEKYDVELAAEAADADKEQGRKDENTASGEHLKNGVYSLLTRPGAEIFEEEEFAAFSAAMNEEYETTNEDLNFFVIISNGEIVSFVSRAPSCLHGCQKELKVSTPRDGAWSIKTGKAIQVALSPDVGSRPAQQPIKVDPLGIGAAIKTGPRIKLVGCLASRILCLMEGLIIHCKISPKLDEYGAKQVSLDILGCHYVLFCMCGPGHPGAMFSPRPFVNFWMATVVIFQQSFYVILLTVVSRVIRPI